MTAGERRQVLQGVLSMAGAAFCFSIMALLVKVTTSRGIPALEVVLARGLVTLVLSYALLVRRRISPLGTHRGLLLLRGALGFGGLCGFYLSLESLHLAEATVIHFTNPIFTAALAALLLAERLPVRHLGAIALAFLGVVVVARPFGGGVPPPPFGVGAALAGAVLSAGAYTTIRRIGRREHPLVVVFWFPLVAVPATLPFAWAGDWVWPRGVDWGLLLGVGVSTQIAQVLMTRGIQLLPAARATGIGYVQIALAALWSVLILDEALTPAQVVGALLIVAATAWLAVPTQGRSTRRRSTQGRSR